MTERKDFIPAAGFNFLTKFYDLGVRFTLPERELRTRLLTELSPDKDEKILEFGFGTAQNLILAKENFGEAKYFGLDIDSRIYDIAQKKIERKQLDIKLKLYEGDRFPYKDCAFDKVFSCLVFHQLHTETKLNCLAEIRRVLKPRGRIVIADWGKAKNRLMRIKFHMVQFLDGYETTKDNVDGRLPEFIKKAKFKEVKETDYINTKFGSFSFYTAIK